MKKKRIRRTPWRWTGSDLLVDTDDEQLWLCPDLPPVSERSRQPVAMHIAYWATDMPQYAYLPTLNDALFALWRAFGHDSVLAAIRRGHDFFSHLLIYTAAPKGIADRRYDDIRQALRPLSMNLRFTEEPRWDALIELMSSVKNGSVQELLR
jgi:hypothetical protein